MVPGLPSSRPAEEPIVFVPSEDLSLMDELAVAMMACLLLTTPRTDPQRVESSSSVPSAAIDTVISQGYIVLPCCISSPSIIPASREGKGVETCWAVTRSVWILFAATSAHCLPVAWIIEARYRLKSNSPSIDIHHRPFYGHRSCGFQVHGCIGFNCYVGIAGNLHTSAGMECHFASTVQTHIAGAGQTHAVVRTLDCDAVASGFVDDFDLFIPIRVIEPDTMATSRMNDPNIVLAITIVCRRGILTVPQG